MDEKRTAWINAAITPELLAKLDRLARATDRSKSAVVRLLIENATFEALNRCIAAVDEKSVSK